MHDRNKHLGSIVVTPGSGYKVWWSCTSCPDSHPHLWETRVAARGQGKGCPFCSGQKLCRHNSLATKAPEVTLYWHPDKNFPLSPSTITACSSYRAHWLCSACKHEWQATVNMKARRNSGCPECAKATSGRNKDGVRQKHPTFASCNHPLLSQWVHSLNGKEGNYPDNTTLGSAKLIWWTCGQCPKGNKHSWRATAKSRAGKQATGCPYCAGHRVCERNSLQTLQPDIAADFDVAANGLTPAEVTASATTMYKWLSDKPGDKLRSVDKRTTHAHSQTRLAKRTQAGGRA